MRELVPDNRRRHEIKTFSLRDHRGEEKNIGKLLGEIRSLRYTTVLPVCMPGWSRETIDRRIDATAKSDRVDGDGGIDVIDNAILITRRGERPETGVIDQHARH